MKKLIIGRNNACDIVIPDTSDLVSRRQAVLTISFLGKMVLYDTSGNGTYINGQKLENGKGRKVTRKDKVNFAHTHDLNWNEIKDPWRKEKIKALLATIIIIVLAAFTVLWFTLSDESHAPESPKEERPHTEYKLTTPNNEIHTTVESSPTEKKNASRYRKDGKHLKKSRLDSKNRDAMELSHKSKESKEVVVDKEVNEKSPIVY